ncbi:glycosyltransferase [Candidatus Pelagibacter sp.]|uniref:glycosyltransferase n=1 Tax=Candidatus Pelagibacter sp. TaxID=2024849 RepID=UPI003F86C616
MNILIEGWRNINHSYALVNQWQMIELGKISNISFKDVPYLTENWNKIKNDSGLNNDMKNIINSFKKPSENFNYDITYRISAPFNFNTKFNSKLLVVFATTEYKNLTKRNYLNGDISELSKKKNFFIHTPSNWSKDGFLKAGFREDQIIVIPHGVEISTFCIISEDEKRKIRDKFKIKADDFVLTNIGAMTQNKGIESLVAAYGLLKKKNKNLKLILKDQSNLYDIKVNYIFEKLIKSDFNKKYKIINDEMLKDVIIISKNLSLKQLREIYSITNCYVSSYMAEGFNMTPLEAAGCGTQIAVTKGGSTDDYFNECMGYQIESDERKVNNDSLLNPKLDSLIEILNKIINKTDESKLIRSKYVHENFSWQNITKKLKKEFEIKLSK